jgi:hypothetical protein
MMSLSRRHVLAFGSAAAGSIAAPWLARAQGVEFSCKHANNLPDTHPVNARGCGKLS